jgi:hypothetical protein
MKRFILAAAMAAAAMLMLASSASATANPATIYAGQNMPAGSVLVTPGDPVTVAINLDSGWCMTQSQVAVTYDPMLLPTTKKGNPQPGQFPFKTTYAGCIQSDTYTIQPSQIPGVPGATLYVAVHTDLFSTETHTMDVVSHVGADSFVYGPLYEYKAWDDAAWGSQKLAIMPTFALTPTWPQIAGATYISTAALTEMNSLISTVYAPDGWRMHKLSLTPPAGSYLLGGEVTLQANADNAQRVWFNNSVLSPLSGNQGAVEGMCSDTHQWNSIETYKFTPVAGTNTLAFVWRNFGLGPLCGLQYSQSADPTGLIYKATIGYYSPTNHGETGWAAGIGFEGSNWATFMEVPLS